MDGPRRLSDFPTFGMNGRATPMNVGCRGERTITIFCAERNARMIATMSDTAADRYRREADECRRSAENALRPIDREAWLRLASDWERLAEGAQLNPLLDKQSPARSR
jgi:hypothetical protein